MTSFAKQIDSHCWRRTSSIHLGLAVGCVVADNTSVDTIMPMGILRESTPSIKAVRPNRFRLHLFAPYPYFKRLRAASPMAD
jgi:hypothetical protein